MGPLFQFCGFCFSSSFISGRSVYAPLSRNDERSNGASDTAQIPTAKKKSLAFANRRTRPEKKGRREANFQEVTVSNVREGERRLQPYHASQLAPLGTKTERGDGIPP